MEGSYDRTIIMIAVLVTRLLPLALIVTLMIYEALALYYDVAHMRVTGDFLQLIFFATGLVRICIRLLQLL